MGGLVILWSLELGCWSFSQARNEPVEGGAAFGAASAADELRAEDGVARAGDGFGKHGDRIAEAEGAALAIGAPAAPRERAGGADRAREDAGREAMIRIMVFF